MKHFDIRLVPLILLLLATSTFAQEPPKDQRPPTTGQPAGAGAAAAPVPCPALNLQPLSARTVREGSTVRFQAGLSGGDAKVTPILSWSISAGALISGQGTTQIEVDSTGAAEAKSITATLLVGGYAAECPYMAEATIKVVGPARKVYDYGEVTDEQLTDLVDRLLAATAADEQAYIIVYAGRNSIRGAAAANVRKIKAHVQQKGLAGNRLIAIDGGFKEQASGELWIVPMGAEAPRPAPTINAKDIVFPKSTPTKKP